MRSLFVIFVGAVSVVLSGCTGVQSVGSLAIPESGFAVYDIRGEHGFSPSWSAGVIVNALGEAVVVAPGTEGGLFGRLIGSGTSLGSAYLFGHSIRPDTYTDSSSTVVTSGSAAKGGNAAAKGGNASSNSDASARSKSDASARSKSDASARSKSAPQVRITNNNTANGGRGGAGGAGGDGGAGGAGGQGPPDNRPPNNRPPNNRPPHGDD